MSAGADPLDAGALIAALQRYAVDYVVIGGIALQAHGHVRTTQDLDVIAAWTPDNLARRAAALGDLDARLRGVDADLLDIDLPSPDDLYQGANFLMHTPRRPGHLHRRRHSRSSAELRDVTRARHPNRHARDDGPDCPSRTPHPHEDGSRRAPRPAWRQAPPGPRRRRRPHSAA